MFNLANDNALAAFDVHQLPAHLVNQIVLASLASVDLEKLAAAVQTTRDRYAAVQLRASGPVAAQPAAATATTETALQAPVFAQVFKMPEPPEQTPATLQQLCTALCKRVLASRATVAALPKANGSVTGKQRAAGLSKRLGASWDKETWLYMTIRLASRGLGKDGLEEDGVPENPQTALARQAGDREAAAHSARDLIYAHVMEDFRGRMDLCTAWLTEEWYNQQTWSSNSCPSDGSRYETLTMRVLEGIFPFIESKDRLLMRFLSDLPDLTERMIAKLKVLCLDPDRSALGYTTLQYLIMLRPPVREMCLDVVERLHMEDSKCFESFRERANVIESELVQQEKILKRWRPDAINGGSDEKPVIAAA